MGIIAAGQITVVDLSDAPVLNTFITASRPTTQTYSKDSRTYKPSYASTPQVLTLKVTKAGSTANIIDSISSLHWFVVDGPIKTEITSKDNSANEYISGTHNEILTTKLDIDLNKGSKRYEVMGIWPDPSTGLDVQFGGYIDLLLTQNGATGPQGPQGDTGNGIANTVVTYGLSMSDTTEPATWSSERPALVKGMYLWTRTVIIYTNGSSTTSYQISYIPQDADATAEIDKTKQELLEKLETVRDESLEAVDEAKQQLVTVRDESLAAAEEAKQGLINVNTKVDNAKAELTQAKQQLTTISDDLSKAKTDFQNAVSAVDTKATNLKNDLTQAKQDLASQAQQLQEQASAQSELTNRVSSVEKTANGTKTTVSELSKTVAQNGKDITSVTARTKVVEDDLSGTKTTLSQVKTTADSTSQKTATLETGLNGLSAKFETLKIGSRNYFKDSKSRKYYINDVGTQDVRTFIDDEFWQNDTRFTKDYVRMSFDIAFNPALPSNFTTNVHFSESPWYNCGGITFKGGTTDVQHFDLKFDLSSASKSYKTDNVFIRLNNTLPINTAVTLENFNLYLSAVVEDYTQNEADLEQKVAEYKQNADQNYASLQTTVQNLDGTVQHNKTVADQTAQGFTTRIESLETYKNGESTRANQYFESARTETARQLTAERTAIARDYVAKSTYTSDVTGIRNDLSATTTTANTTKTNLANYQASNDRAVANLQTNLQTANGNISSLKTKVEAVPGQITSAVSSVESKIPTEIGTVNLLKNSKTFTGSGITGSGTLLSETYQGCAVRYLKVTGEVVIAEFSNCVYPKLGGEYVASFWAKGKGGLNVFFHGNRGYLGVAKGVSSEGNETTRGDGLISFNLTADWKRYWIKYKMKTEPSSASSVGKHLLFRTLANGLENEVYLAGAQLEEGSVVSGYEPAPEDTATQISNLSSQIKQTADGISLLATKTELNNAKNELQSGINTATNKANSAQSTANNNAQTISTHTTQISALNTGLQAKVSQTDFNTLSGRVTTAENNITAKANELSSKITSVEGKIPTSVGGRNLWIQSKVTGGFVEETLPDNHITGQKKCYRITNNNEISFNIEPDFSTRLYRKVTFSAWVKYDNVAQGSNNWNVFNCFKHSLYYKNSSTGATTNANYLTLEGFTGTSGWKHITYTYDYAANKSYDQLKTSIRFNIESARSGTAWVTGIKIEIGSIPSDYSPAPEDTISQISSLSSELKQTKDGITLLATKTELNTAKSDLQSGINTATNKANAAQNTANSAQSTANSAQNKANSNAQTISTHTTQISALNTGLQAKVSQTDFNTLSGRVTNAENNITAKANELSSKITSVEGKIPTNVSTRNLILKSNDFANPHKQSGANTTVSSTNDYFVIRSTGYTANAWGGMSWNISISEVKAGEQFSILMPVYIDSSVNLDSGFSFDIKNHPSNISAYGYSIPTNKKDQWFNVAITFKISRDVKFDTYPFYVYIVKNGLVRIKPPMLVRGNLIPSDWQPAPEDTISDITKLNTTLTQTSDGLKQLSTKVTSQGNTITSHTNSINSLTTGLNAKVSQSDFNTLSGRVTTAENNITAKANELSSKITSVEGKIPTSVGSTNLLLYSADPWNAPNGYYQFIGAIKTDEKLNGSIVYKTNGAWCSLRSNWGKHLIDRKNVKVGDEFTYSIYAKTDQSSIRTRLFIRYSGQGNAEALSSEITLTNEWKKLSVTFKVTQKMVASQTKLSWVGFEQTSNSENGKFVYYACNKLERGNIATDWSPAPEDTINQINSVSSEFKQTTDSIKASVTSLDKSTVKNSSLTINSDGIVMKAGKSTTDVANAIGSYFSVNQNAIDLFADKIKVKGNMIVSGSISSDKIASNGITANVIKGGTLQSTNGSTNFELNTGKLFYNNNNTGVFRVQNGASTMGLKFSNTSVTVSGTSRILSRVILGGDRNETTLDDGKWDKGGFSGLVIETIKGAIPAVNEHADSLRAISDTIYFTHTYSADSPTGVSAHGWKMETYAPDSSISGNIVLKPYGINYRQSDIVVGDIRLDNGDGSGYWMRATINTLKACFGHILNGGTSSQALNAIRSELNKISGT